MSDEIDNPNGEFYVSVSLLWAAGQPATEEDCKEALLRSGIRHGDLIGEFLIQDIERPEDAS